MSRVSLNDDDGTVDRPFNSWNRMPYWTLNGVDDGFGSWPNVSKPAPGASAVKDFDRIRRNFVFTVSSVSMECSLENRESLWPSSRSLEEHSCARESARS